MRNLTLPEGHFMKVFHLHPMNSSKNKRSHSKYKTVAIIFNNKDAAKACTLNDALTGETMEHEICRASAKCFSGRKETRTQQEKSADIPSRKRGYSIATGRALRKLYDLQEYDNDDIQYATEAV